jgi:hypothetical protein
MPKPTMTLRIAPIIAVPVPGSMYNANDVNNSVNNYQINVMYENLASRFNNMNFIVIGYFIYFKVNSFI